ncbi:MAG TPA: aminoacyl-tRNA hydrolase [Roseiarcus sp.]|nr:aminoacyl-tRNA hydrolase [Roseiarcus sp.]
MLVIAGLGNPGLRHARNRHNVGFMAVDAIAERQKFGPFRARWQGLAAEGLIGETRVMALKPQTYMNDSGRSVGEALRYMKLDLSALIVIHDELDLAPGKVRVKVGGGEAGHNGLRSVTAHVGPGYKRVRIGIGHPGDKALVYHYVLSDFAKSEAPWVGAVAHAIAEAAPFLVAGRDASFQNKVHLAMEAAGFGEKPEA